PGLAWRFAARTKPKTRYSSSSTTTLQRTPPKKDKEVAKLFRLNHYAHSASIPRFFRYCLICPKPLPVPAQQVAGRPDAATPRAHPATQWRFFRSEAPNEKP